MMNNTKFGNKMLGGSEDTIWTIKSGCKKISSYVDMAETAIFD